MDNSPEVLSLVLDAISEHIVVIDDVGEIQYVNKSWSNFGHINECNIGNDWRGVNYLHECDKASAAGDYFGTNAGLGIRRVINEHEPTFYLEYPCHSPDEDRWFLMRVMPLSVQEKRYFVMSHLNITERKLAELEVLNLAKIDGLTDIPNRRHFDEFLQNEWLRCQRLQKPVSLALVDLDHFKQLNDTYGHQAGDECLQSVAALLKTFASRAGDICARYGGEEFALIWGDTTSGQAKELSTQLLEGIRALNIANSNSPAGNYLTASIGVATIVPTNGRPEDDLIREVDLLLYRAKRSGRNRVEF